MININISIRRYLNIIALIGCGLLLTACRSFESPISRQAECVNLRHEIVMIENNPYQNKTFTLQRHLNQMRERYIALGCQGVHEHLTGTYNHNNPQPNPKASAKYKHPDGN